MTSAPDRATAPVADAPIGFRMPDNACDCHVHVLRPDRFPYAQKRVYTPPVASAAALAAFEDSLGMTRMVVVQPSVYGVDNACLLDALRELGPRSRGVAVIDLETPEETLEILDRAGTRGVRLNLETEGVFDPAISRRRLAEAADRVRPRGWHVQIATRLAIVEAMADTIAGSGVPVVLDHFAGARAGEGRGQAGFGALLTMLRSGHVFVKLSAAYRLAGQPDDSDVADIARALIEAAPDRMLWASDWPHTAHGKPGSPDGDVDPFFDIDDRASLGLLADWAPDAGLRQKILVDNPARLYGF